MGFSEEGLEIHGLLPESVLERLRGGEPVAVTDQGNRIGRFVPDREPLSNSDKSELLNQFRRFREAHPLGGLAVRDLIDEGRRY